MRMSKQRINFMVFAVALCASGNAFALKKCVDADGKTHYGDTAEASCNKN